MLTINDYKNWASHNQNAAVSLNRNADALVDYTTRVGGVARFFNFKSAQRARAEAMKDFTRALGARYGATIAQHAISAAGLSKTSSLRGWNIDRAIQVAKNMRAAMLRPGGHPANLRFGGVDLTGVQVGAILADKGNAVTKFLKQRAVAVQLLGEMPLSQEDYQDYHARAESLLARLGTLRNAEVQEGIPADDFRRMVDGLADAVRDKDSAARNLLQDGRPLGEVNVREYKEVWREAAVAALTSMYDAAILKEDIPTASVLDRAITLLKNDQRTRDQFHATLQLDKDVEKKFIKPFLAGLVGTAKRQLTQEHVNVRRAKVKTDDFGKEIKAGFRKALNARPWETVSKTVAATVGGRPVVLGSTISPAEQLGRSEGAPRGPIAGTYPEGVHGYMCHSAETNHAVNLAVTKLSVGEPGGAGETVFTGVRHGVHCAWEVRGANERAAANANRAKEAVIAAFIAKYDAEGAPQLPDAGDDGQVVVDLEMTSVSLLTPDPIRHKTKRNSSEDERTMLREQTEAWDSVEQTGVTFEYRGRQISIRPRVLKFNFGVNSGAVNFSAINNLTGGWRVSGPMNNAAFQSLEQDASAFIAANPGSPKAQAAQTLLDQCRGIQRTRGERSDSHDAYKFAARVAVLSNLIGKVPCWNCKSGKDRTGQMDVECKFLSTLIARGERVPAPGAQLTKEQKALFRSIALEGGNFEIQKMNTGLAGFKTGGVSSIPERLGGKEYREVHSGGSKYVNV